MCYCASGQLYFKSQGDTRLMMSPMDETPSVPCDAQPELIDVATVVDRFNRSTQLSVDQVDESWAGLRTFVPDQLPVIGYDDEATSFFWLAALGGFGVQTAPAYSRLAAAMLSERDVPAGMLVTPDEVKPARTTLRNSPMDS